MKILHIATLNSAATNIGVVRQMQYELDAARRLEIDWDVQLWVGDTLPGFDFIKTYPESVKSRISRRLAFSKILCAASEHYDVILLRYMPVDLFLPFFSSRSSKVFFVSHSNEVTSIRGIFPGTKGIFLSLVERILGRASLKRADGIVGVTPELVRLKLAQCGRADVSKSELRNYVYPNGIDYCAFDIVRDDRAGRVKVAFVASKFFSWHGLSQILASLQKFNLKRDVELHLIGDVLPHDLVLIESLGLTDNVVLHGKLSLSLLRNKLSEMDVGLASFGLGEAGVNEACTLKVREYLAAGIPVYSGHRDVGFPADFKFYKIGHADISEVYNYALEMRGVVRSQVRSASQGYIDKEALVRELHGWLLCSVKG